MALFVTVLIVSNIASSAKIVDWGVSLFGVRLAFDAGTILFPVSYIFGDVLTEVYGYRRSRRVIWTGFACLAPVGAGAGHGAHSAREKPPGKGMPGRMPITSILGGFSSGGIVVASLVAYWAGEFSNSYILARMKVLTAGRWLWARTIGSTIAGEGVDTLVFTLVATAGGRFPWEIFWSLVITNYLFKVGVEALMTPLTYAVVNNLKRLESEDYFDRSTDFNPFRLSLAGKSNSE